MHSFPLNLFDQQITFAMPDRLYRLVQAASMNCFDPWIGYGYAMDIIAEHNNVTAVLQ